MPLDKRSCPELSIIVPVLNEMEQLPNFFADLASQEKINFELLICDGESSDGSFEWLQQQEPDWAELKVVQGPAGRGRQLNLGREAAGGEWLLFLHSDSRFPDPLALRRGLDCLTRFGSAKVAGHFSLKFRREDNSPSFGYYFYEWKARLGRPETIHGDQGFFIHRQLLEQVGCFNEDLPVMEDTDFAERLRAWGQWHLLPVEISTSARRFETEGLWQRQLLGALIMCFRDIGWSDFFGAAPEVYRQQKKTEKLEIKPFFHLIRQLFSERSGKERLLIWYKSGSYVRNHAWQLWFAIDARRAFRLGKPVGAGSLLSTEFFEPLFNFVTNNPPGRFMTTLLLRLWFELTDLWLRKKERS